MTTGNEFLSLQLNEAANSRADVHADHASSRPLSEGYEGVGIAGEWAFAQFCGLMPDLERKPGGDKGIDFVVPLFFTVDVKTARKAGNLIHEQGKPFADIFILAEYDDDAKAAQLVGWEWGAKLRIAPTKDFGYGVINHYIPRAQLRNMRDLRKYIRIIK